MGERRNRTAEVSGSIPLSSTKQSTKAWTRRVVGNTFLKSVA